MRLIDSSADSEYMAKKVHGTHGCYVVPAFTGLGAPHWDQYARGTIVGITRGTNKNHIIRATLESIDLQVCDVIDAMRADAGVELKSLKVDGGASANNFLMQFQADMINAPVKRPSCIETTAMAPPTCRTCRWLLEEQGRCHQKSEYRPDILSSDERGGTSGKTERLEQSGQIRLRLGERRTGRGRRIDYYSLG